MLGAIEVPLPHRGGDQTSWMIPKPQLTMKVAPVEPRTLSDGTGGRFSTCAVAVPVHMAFAV